VWKNIQVTSTVYIGSTESPCVSTNLISACFVMLHTSVATAATSLIKDNYKYFFWHHHLYDSFQPPRSAHPNVKFTCTSQEPMVIENLPFDKYEMEPSPLTQFILARKQPTVCWQVNYKNYVLVVNILYILFLHVSFSAPQPVVLIILASIIFWLCILYGWNYISSVSVTHYMWYWIFY